MFYIIEIIFVTAFLWSEFAYHVFIACGDIAKACL